MKEQGNPTRNGVSKSRVLQVIHSTDPESGGPIEVVRRIAEMLLNAGYQVEFASLESQKDVSSRSLPFPAIGLGARERQIWIQPATHAVDSGEC